MGYAGWYSMKTTREILFFVPFMQVLMIGPVVYFYTKSLLNPNFRIAKKDWFHFLPSVLYLSYSIIVFVGDKIILDEFYFYADGRDKDLSNWYQISGLISIAVYLVLSLRVYSRYRKLVFETVSYADSILFSWLKHFMVALFIILALRVLFFITNPEWGEFGSQFWYYISFSFVFYYISLNGYANAIKKDVLSTEMINAHNFNYENKTENGIDAKTESQIKDIEVWKKRIVSEIEREHLYKNPKLTLSDLANRLDTTPKLVSQIVNTGFNLNFNDFVNRFRVEAVKNQLQKGKQKDLTLLAIALECGFNSKSTFNRAFKKSTSLSPKGYIEKFGKK